MASERSIKGGGREVAIAASPLFQSGATFSGQWMGPGAPLPAVAPPETAGRRWDYSFGLNQYPRRDRAGPITFEQLRGLADGYDLLRTVIEARKDQVERLKWNIKPRDPKAKIEGDLEARIRRAEDLFRRPDRRQWWGSWMRELLEDLFVLDAPTVYRRRTIGGDLYALELIDGATIDVLIDSHGRTPIGDAPAYQQRLKGMQAVDYLDRDLIYRPRNRRTHKNYGYSPVEQIIMTVNIAIRRQMFQLAYYTEGNVPEALVGVPDSWTPEQITSFQASFDGMMAGNLATRRRLHFIPSSAAKGYQPTKTDNIFGDGEEWLARVTCFALSVSPQPFLKMMNRATAESADDQASEEGLIPLMGYIKGLFDEVLIDDLGSPDLEWAWHEESELKPKDQSEVIRGEVDGGLITRNEGRGMKGLDPIADPYFDKLTVKTAKGVEFVSPTDQLEVALARQKALGPAVVPGEGDDDENEADEAPSGSDASGGGADDPDGGGDGAGAGEGKGAKAATDPDPALKAAPQGPPAPVMNRPKVLRAEARLTKAVGRVLTDLSLDLAGQVEQLLRPAGKAGDDGFDLDALLAQLDLDTFDVLVDQAREDFFAVADDAGRIALGQVGAETIEGAFEQVNLRAREYADRRAAELVGRRRTGDGRLVPSRNPAMAITDSTRELLRGLIERGIAENLSADEIADRIQTDAGFGPDRARLIAHTEIAMANSEGALNGYRVARENGVSVKKEWLLGPNPCPTCQANAAAGPVELDDEFPSGHLTTPGHPRCECAIAPVVGDDDENGAGGA